MVRGAGTLTQSNKQRVKVQACDSSIGTAEPMLPVTQMASSVAATGKRCSRAKISAASAEWKNFVMAASPVVSASLPILTGDCTHDSGVDVRWRTWRSD
jgi:hypothetical protein